MNWNGEFWATNTSAAVPSEGLNMEKLREIMRSLPPAPPPTPRYDLAAHDLNEAYEINPMPELKHALGWEKDRRMLAVPRAQLMDWYRKLRAMGLDVRIVGADTQEEPAL